MSPSSPGNSSTLRGDGPDLLTVHRACSVPGSIRAAAVSFPVGVRWCSVTVNPYSIGITICTLYTGRSCVLWHFSTDSFPVSGPSAPADNGSRAVTFQIAYSRSFTKSIYDFVFLPLHIIFTCSNKYFFFYFPGPSNN